MNRKLGSGLRRSPVAAVVAALLVAGACPAEAAMPTRAEKCEAKKNRVAGEYADCLAAAEKKFALFGDATEYAARQVKCEQGYSRDFTKAETNGDGECPSTGDRTGIQGFLDSCHAS